MSRIGKKLITVPAGVTIEQADRTLTVRGARGQLSWVTPEVMNVAVSEGNVIVTSKTNHRDARALHGLTRQLIASMVVGVSEGYRKLLEMKGTGYRAELQGNELVISAGYSHPVRITAPEGITFKVEKNVQISVEGIDKQLVGETCAKIRAVRPPEPYKGKGIRYHGEVIRLKPGKTAKSQAG